MKKRIILILGIIVLGIGIYFIMKNIPVSNEKLLKKIGYSDEEVSTIIKNEVYLEYALKNEYIKSYADFINEKDFKIEYIDKYIAYQKENNKAPISDIVYLVNNNITNTYSTDLMAFTKEKYFLITRLERYLNYKANHSDIDYKEVVKRVNSDIDYGFYQKDVSTDLSYGYQIICNKFYKLESSYVPQTLVNIESKYLKPGTGGQLESETYEAFKKLSDAARNEGLSVLSRSPYRSYNSQSSIYNNYVKTDGKANADTYSARPGYSEHQTGFALDVGTKTNISLRSFKDTKEYNWMLENAHKFGFILRYPDGEEYITGYTFEPWHYRYVGVEAATTIKNENITYEEYYSYYVLKK